MGEKIKLPLTISSYVSNKHYKENGSLARNGLFISKIQFLNPLNFLIDLKGGEEWRKFLKFPNKPDKRLEWIIYYHLHSASQTAHYFSIARRTFYKWFAEFDKDILYSLYRLEDQSRAPKKTREPEISSLEKQRIIELRKKYLRYSKMKLKKIYSRLYGQSISSWQIQRVIQEKNLYFNPVKTAKIQQKRRQAKKKTNHWA